LRTPTQHHPESALSPQGVNGVAAAFCDVRSRFFPNFRGFGAGLTTPRGLATIGAWASTSGKWRISAGPRPARRRQYGVRPRTRSSRTPSAWLPPWNERQAKRMPMLFFPTIGAAIAADYWFLPALCPACRTTGDADLWALDWHRNAAVTALIPALSCRSCRRTRRSPNWFAYRSRALPRSITRSVVVTGE
jgi:hypothetical protein